MLCGVLFLDGLDLSLVGVALPSIQRDLGVSDSQLQWVVSGYVLGYGGFLLLGGRAADLLGRRRTLLAALAVFAVASLIGGLASDPGLLLATRFLKGASAAFTAPAGLSIITTSFPEGPERNRALSVYSATGASGFSLGLVVGGLMTQIGWRWALVLPAPVAALLLVAGLKVLPAERPRLHVVDQFDVPGAATLTVAMLLLVGTIVEAPALGWAATAGALAVTAVLLTAFVIVERRSRAPLVRLGIFRLRGVARANFGIMALFGAYIGFQFVMTLYLQTLNHWSPIKTAMAFLPVGVLIAVSAGRIGPVIHRIGIERLVAAGFAAMSVGYGLLLRLGGTPDWLAILLPTTVLIGVGIGLAFPTMNVQATSGVPAHEQGLAAALFQTSNQLGAALVLAVVTAVVTGSGATATGRAVVLHAYRDGLLVVTAVAALGLVFALTALVPRRAPTARVSEGAGVKLLLGGDVQVGVLSLAEGLVEDSHCLAGRLDTELVPHERAVAVEHVGSAHPVAGARPCEDQMLVQRLPVRVELDATLSVLRRARPVTDGCVRFSEDLSRGDVHVVQAITLAECPRVIEAAEEWALADDAGDRRVNGSLPELAMLQLGLGRMQGMRGSLDIDTRVAGVQLVAAEGAIDHPRLETGARERRADLADDRAQRRLPGARQAVGPQLPGQLVPANRVLPLDDQHRQGEAPLVPWQGALAQERPVILDRQPAGYGDPHRPSIASRRWPKWSTSSNATVTGPAVAARNRSSRPPSRTGSKCTASISAASRSSPSPSPSRATAALPPAPERHRRRLPGRAAHRPVSGTIAVAMAAR